MSGRRRIALPFIGAAIWLLCTAPLGAQVDAADDFATPQQEAMYGELLRELRCLVCANQSLFDSNASLAGDLRTKVHTLVMDGHSREEIVDFMVARYGEYILYRPRLSIATWLLWFAPPLVFFGGLWFVLRRARAKRRAAAHSAADRARARALLDGTSQ